MTVFHFFTRGQNRKYASAVARPCADASTAVEFAEVLLHLKDETREVEVWSGESFVAEKRRDFCN